MRRVSFASLGKGGQTAMTLLTVLCGFALLWGSTSGRRQGEETLSQAASRAIEIDPATPSTKHIGQLVVAAGEISSQEMLEDPFIKPGPYLVLLRRVEMFQWVERFRDSALEQPDYALEWIEGQVDFLSFRQPEGHENPVLKHESARYQVRESTFGGFDARKILDSITLVPPLALSGAILKDSSTQFSENTIIIRRELGRVSDGLGDMRLSFFALPQGPYTVAARQVDEMTLIGAGANSELVVKPGKLSAGELFDEVGKESSNAYSGLLYVGGAVLFLGIFSLLRSIAPELDLRPKLEVKGAAAALVVSAGVSIVTMLIFVLLEWTGL